MRPIVKLMLACSAMLGAAPAVAATVVETFETAGPKDTPIFAPLVRPIGTFTGLAGSPGPNVFISSPGYTNFGAGNNPTTSSILTANGDESFDVALAFGARTVSLDLYLNDFGPATLNFYNGATLLQSFTYAAAANNFLNQSYTSPGTAITRFTFASTNGGTLNTGIDNVTATAVPEPVAWAMLIAGFAAVGAGLRRRPRRSLATA